MEIVNAELEVIVFGPGFGESILIHYGNNNWIIVDSGINPISKKVFALEYLESICIDPAVSVKLIVGTHWHDDHIKGLSQTVQKCRNAEFVCSSAIGEREFLELVEIYKDVYITDYNGISEFSSILSMFKNSSKSPKLAIDDKLLFKDSNISVFSLSPSSQSILNSVSSISNLHPKKNSRVTGIKHITPNHASVVLWVNISDFIILLGADLEETNEPKTGWSAVLNCKVINSKASIFKIPHHGSKNGHNQEVWDKVVIKDVYSAVTPFTKLKNPLPTQGDISRICSLTSNAFTTSNKILTIKRPEVDKFLNRIGKKVYRAFPDPSSISFKYKTNTNIETFLLGEAHSLCNK